MSSCLEYKGVVTINKDGSATLEETSLIGPQFKAMMGSVTPKDKDGAADRSKAEERAKVLGEGVMVKSHEEITQPNGSTGMKVVYTVPDITKLKYAPEGSKDKKKVFTFTRSGNTLTIHNPEDQKDIPLAPEMPRDAKREQLGGIKPMLAGLHFNIEVKVPGGIASTDASHVAGDIITLMDFELDKIKNDERLIDVLDSMHLTAAQAAAQFKGVDGVKVEGKEAIKIEMK